MNIRIHLNNFSQNLLCCNKISVVIIVPFNDHNVVTDFVYRKSLTGKMVGTNNNNWLRNADFLLRLKSLP